MKNATTIVVTAGHGGDDPGAISFDGRYKESDLALQLRNQIANDLRARGLSVVTDGRSETENQPIRDAVALAKRNTGPAIEIHFNGASQMAAGIEVLSMPESKYLAQSIAAAISKWTKSPLRGQSGWKPASAGQHHRRGFCEAGGLVVEVEFITNTGALETYLRVANEVGAAIADELASAIN